MNKSLFLNSDQVQRYVKICKNQWVLNNKSLNHYNSSSGNQLSLKALQSVFPDTIEKIFLGKKINSWSWAISHKESNVLHWSFEEHDVILTVEIGSINWSLYFLPHLLNKPRTIPAKSFGDHPEFFPHQEVRPSIGADKNCIITNGTVTERTRSRSGDPRASGRRRSNRRACGRWRSYSRAFRGFGFMRGLCCWCCQ